MNNNELRERLLLPVLIPVGALAFVGFLAMTMAAVLLRVPPNVATAVAMMVAFNLLVAFAILALKPDLGRSLLLAVGGVAVFPVLLGAAAAAGLIPVEGGEEEHKAAAAPVEVSAQGLAFDVKELKIPADTEFEIAFNNQEAQPHNIAILEAQGSPNALFKGEVITGPKEQTYKVDPIPAGNYYFQCDVHPNMNGTVVAEEGQGGGGGGQEGEGKAAASAVEVSAQGLAFDVKELKIPADTEFEIAFNNQEAQPHNIAILEAQGSPNALFKGEVITGPKEQTYKVDPIPAGNYYFQCDVHPNMSGTVVAA